MFFSVSYKKLFIAKWQMPKRSSEPKFNFYANYLHYSRFQVVISCCIIILIKDYYIAIRLFAWRTSHWLVVWLLFSSRLLIIHCYNSVVRMKMTPILGELNGIIYKEVREPDYQECIDVFMQVIEGQCLIFIIFYFKTEKCFEEL